MPDESDAISHRIADTVANIWTGTVGDDDVGVWSEPAQASLQLGVQSDHRCRLRELCAVEDEEPLMGLQRCAEEQQRRAASVPRRDDIDALDGTPIGGG